MCTAKRLKYLFKYFWNTLQKYSIFESTARFKVWRSSEVSIVCQNIISLIQIVSVYSFLLSYAKHLTLKQNLKKIKEKSQKFCWRFVEIEKLEKCLSLRIIDKNWNQGIRLGVGFMLFDLVLFHKETNTNSRDKVKCYLV